MSLAIPWSPTLAQEFKYDSYVRTTLEEIYKQAPDYEEGAALLLENRQFEVELVESASQCESGWAEFALKTQGVPRIPAMNYCIIVRSESGLVNEVQVQDVLVGTLSQEVKVGQRFRAFVLWFAWNAHTKKPHFILNAFDTEDVGER